MQKIITVILILSVALTAKALNQQMLSTDNQLSSSLVNNLYQDRYGMLWIATEDGLNRYDGAKCTVYRHSANDSTSLASNFVLSVSEDRQGRLYVGTHCGVQLFDHASERFSPVLKNMDGTPYLGRVSSMLKLSDGEFLVFGNEVRKTVTMPSGEVRLAYPDIPNSSLTLIPNGVEDSNGNLWLAKDEDGILRIDRSKRIKHYFGYAGAPSIQQIAVSSAGIIFATTYKGELLRYNPAGDAFETAYQMGAVIKAVTPERDGSLILSTDGKGLYRFDPGSDSVTEVPFGDDLFDSRIQKVHGAIRDNDGNLWIAIYQKGVMLVPARPSKFGYIGRKSFKSDIIGQNCITSVLRDSDGSLLVGTDNDGIYVVSPDGRTSRHISGTVPPIIIDMFRDSHGNTWVGSFSEGAGILDKSSGTLRHVPLIEDNERGHDADRAYKFAEDSNGNVWIATMGLGLFCYNHSTGRAVDKTSILPAKALWIPSIAYSRRNDILYVGTYDGISVLRNFSGKIRGEHLLGGVIINTLKEDGRGNLWIGTQSGLVLFNPKNSASRIFTVDDGLPSNAVYGIEPAGDELWISTNAGLARYNPAKGVFSSFFVSDGLQGNEFYKNASMTDTDGTLWFGGVNGLTHFNPKEITAQEQKRKARIIDFYVNGKKVTTLSQSGGRSIIDKAVFLADRFELAPADNSFSVELGTRELDRHDGIVFMYSLDGEPWQMLPPRSGRINFGDISYGTHTLRFKALDNGVASDEETVQIHIRYPWWLSTWGIITFVLIAIAVAAFVYVRVKAYRRLKAEEEERLRAREISEAKLQFFTNIAHEIRTPISLVVSPLKKLIGTDDNPQRQKEYQTMNRNASRILNLINELMDLRKIDNGKMRIDLKPVEIGDYVGDVVNIFANAAESHDLELKFDNRTPSGLTVMIDPHNFDKIVSNLLSNAIKYTPRGGHVDVVLEQTAGADGDNGNLVLTVCDDGPGIPKAEREHVFERFYKTADSLSAGTGIGLHLTRSLVEMHGGSIEVTDNPGAASGACFHVTIPLRVTIPLMDDQQQEAVPSEPERAARNRDGNVEPEILVTMNSSKAPAPDMHQGRGKVVLIVEDDAEIRSYLAENLSKKYRVIQCSDGAEALNLIHVKSPDIVISDVMMPGIDGLTLTRKIKQNVNLNQIPVILLTAKTDERDTLEGLETGADAYMTKPFSIDVLEQTVTNLLAGRQLLRNAYSGAQDQEKKVEDIDIVSSDEKLMSRIMRVVNRHISDPELTVEFMASEVGISRAHLHRKIKELTNQSPRDFVKAIRLKQAARLLREKSLTVAEVSESTGFRSPNYFSTAFKEMYGTSPTEYSKTGRDEE